MNETAELEAKLADLRKQRAELSDDEREFIALAQELDAEGRVGLRNRANALIREVRAEERLNMTAASYLQMQLQAARKTEEQDTQLEVE